MPRLFIISGPSGSGKNTLIRSAIEQFPDLLYSVSVTTRAPRPGEKNGRDYFFKTPENFREMIARGELAEYQEVYSGVFYGTPREFITSNIKNKKSVILDIDVYGCMRLIKAFPDAVTIFIDVPSEDVLKERLLKRRSENQSGLEERLRKAGEEVEFSRGRYCYRIVNDNLQKACLELMEIIRKES